MVVTTYTEEERRVQRTDKFFEMINGKLLEVGTDEYNDNVRRQREQRISQGCVPCK